MNIEALQGALAKRVTATIAARKAVEYARARLVACVREEQDVRRELETARRMAG